MKTPAKRIVFKSPTELKASAAAGGNLPDTLEVARTGYWDAPWHGEFTLTSADFEEAVAHFDAGVYRVQGTEPLPAGLDHFTGPATFRITGISTQQDAATGATVLMADVTWTELGKEKIERDEYRYVSFEYNDRTRPFVDPENANNVLVNVLTGATLTNDPLFKKLKPIMASARSGDNSNQGDSMNLEELRAKEPSTLTADEKTFLTEHKADLTDDERTKFELTDGTGEGQGTGTEGGEGEGTGAGTEAGTEAGDGTEGAGQGAGKQAGQGEQLEAAARPVTITQAELNQLKANAQAGLEAKAQLDRERTENQLKAHVAAGRIKSDQLKEATDILLASAPALRTRIEKLLASLPANSKITSGEQGVTGEDASASKADQLNASAMQMAAKENISFREAIHKLTAANPELANYSEDE